MSKLYRLMKDYGSGKRTLAETVDALLNHVWIYPKRYVAGSEALPSVVTGSWEEIEQAFNDELVDFWSYRLLLRTFDDEIRQKSPTARFHYPPY